MSISDLYDSGFRKRNQDHFAAMVRIAMSDTIITDDEKTFLDRIAINLDISEESYKQILKNYHTHPVNPPITFDSRLERLYDLARMVYADNDLGDKQVIMLERFAVGLGFTVHNVKYVVDKALALVSNSVDLSTFKEEIRMMNR